MQVSSDIKKSSNRRTQRLYALSRQHERYAWLGIVVVILATVLALGSIGNEPQSPGELRAAALWLTFGMLLVPILRIPQGLTALLRPEHFLMLGLCYWVLLDLLQGLNPLYGVSRDEIIGDLCLSL